jgi:hypothetical protein
MSHSRLKNMTKEDWIKVSEAFIRKAWERDD